MILWSQIVEAVLLSFGTAAASITITKSKFFKPLRLWVLLQSRSRGDLKADVFLDLVKGGHTKPSKWYELISCPYCMSHWIAALGVLIFHTNVMGNPAVAGYIVTWLSVIALSSLIGGLVLRSYEE